jgi:RNA polymerase sigma-70 factor (ECF subfamily)
MAGANMDDVSSIKGSDEVLAIRAAGGSVDAFEALVARYERRIYSFLRRRCRNSDDLAELTQATFVEAWTSIARYSPQWRFSTWIFTIASRQQTAMFRTHARQARAAHAAREKVTLRDSRSEAERLVEIEESVCIWAIAARILDPVHHTALWLRYAESFSVTEIARIIDRPAVTTRVILFRARQTLRTALEGGTAGRPEPTPSFAPASRRRLKIAARTNSGALAHVAP